ncbi:MAG: type III secretion protein [Pseudorhodobacter sp.]|nr:MAG: type III secretion protein [Pseudorhodobacter sp.]
MTPDFAGLAELLGMAETAAHAALMVFLRVGAAMALLPAFGEQTVPQRLRLILALAFTAIVWPTVAPSFPETLSLHSAAAEIIAGLALGAVLRLFILALQIAGVMIAQATSLSQIAGGAAPEPLPAVGHMLTMAGLALMVMSGLHVKVAEALILSYDVMPAGGFPAASDLADWGLDHTSRAFGLAFALAAPFTIASMMYNLALGAINRAMPALMVSFIGAPALSAMGLALLAILAAPLLAVWSDALQEFLAAPFEAPP